MKILFKLNQYNQQRQHEKKRWIYPIKLAMYATALKQMGHEIIWDRNSDEYDRIVKSEEEIDIPFLDLPIPNRILTDAMNKKWQKNGNFKFVPATYILSVDGCWHGKCTFCVENKKTYAIRNIEHIMEEIDRCHLLGFKEIFDDSGTFPDGDWLTDFCIKMQCRKYKMVLGCNMRIDADVDFKMMKKAGFRMLLYGIESVNQYTLNRIKKGVNVDKIISTLRKASESGLEPHIAIMLGYPWEAEGEELRTIKFAHYLLRKGYAKTAQASLYTVPGEVAIDRGRINDIYSVACYPDFWIRKFRGIHGWKDFTYLCKQIKKGIVKN